MQGSYIWNKWRIQHIEVQPDLSRADFNGTYLSRSNLALANLSGANLKRAYLSAANLSSVDLSSANLSGAHLGGADLSYANLSEADLMRADLRGANLMKANLRKADLRKADLSWSNLSETNLSEANLTACRVYATSTWNVCLKNTIQTGLIITRCNEATITVDNLEVAQFIYLLLNNTKIREVIDTIAKKAVLLLGRFTAERKMILDAIKDILREQDYLPIVFDFEKPSSQDLTETISTLAHLSRFIIADLTDPACTPHELYAFIPHRMVPVQSLFHESEEAEPPYAMFQDLKKKYHWVLPTFRYKDLEHLIASLEKHVIAPAERKAQEYEK